MADQIEQAGDDALRNQLMTLEAQREQLASLIGDDPKGPMQQLQEELNAAIAGIRQRLDAQAATTAKTVSSLPQEVVTPTSHDNASQFAEGDTCLAPRVFDRRRALALVEEMDEARGTCLVTWVHPRHKRELACRYWKEGRNCKFSGRDCSFSHGIEVPLLELLLPDENYNSSNRGSGQTTSAVNEAGALSREPCAVPEAGVGASAGSGRMSAAERWLATLDAGSRVLARYHDRVWYDATAEHPAVDGFLAVRFTGFEDEGSVSLPANLSHLAPPDYDDGAGSRGGGGVGASPARDDEESELEDAWANDDGDDDEFFFRERVLGDRREDGSARVGVGKGAEAGSCLLTDAYVFGDWEQHTKGFGSRMLSRMGYRRGEGLGKEKQGISRPVPIRVLPERRALDHLRVDGGLRPRPQPGPRKHKSKAGYSSSAGNGGDDDGEPQKAMFDLLNVAIHASARDKGARTAAVGSSSFALARSSLAGRNRPVFDGSSPASRVRGGKTDETVGAVAGGKGGEGSSSLGKSAGNMTRSELRSHLVGAREAETALAAKAARLEETVARNSERDPQIAAAAKRKLEEIRVQAREVRASMDQAERVLGHRKEKCKSGKGGLFSF